MSHRVPWLSCERLEALLERFRSLQIGLVGDLFLDRYLEIDPALAEVSIETGLEAYQVVRVRNSPGALGTIINNLAALGVGRLVPVTVIGDDGEGYDLLAALARLARRSGTQIETGHVIRDEHRQTPTYTKPLVPTEGGAWRELNRLDLRNRSGLSAAMRDVVARHLERVFDQSDGLIVLDQVHEEGGGVVHAGMREQLVQLARRAPKKLIFVDSRAHIDAFHVGVLKPNLSECYAALGRPAPSEGAIDVVEACAVASELSRRRGLALYGTLGSQGMVVAEPHAEPVHVPAVPVSGPIDIVGAGDSATSGIVSARLAAADAVEAAVVGNLVASITIQQLGTTGTATPAEVLARCREFNATRAKE